MAERRSRDSDYVVVTGRKPKVVRSYYVDSDDDNDLQPTTVTRRVIRKKPSKEKPTAAVETNNGELDDGKQANESTDHGIKVRNTTNGEQVILDEDDNILKIIRNPRSPTPSPPPVEKRRIKVRRREPRVVYYDNSDNYASTRPSKRYESLGRRPEYVYVDEESPKIIRKIIVDPRASDQDVIYEKERSRKHHSPHRLKARKPVSEVFIDGDDDYDQVDEQPEYVKIVRRRLPPPREIMTKKEPPTKYVMIRKRLDSEANYRAVSPPSSPIITSRRVVYESSPKKSTTKYVYASDGKYYK